MLVSAIYKMWFNNSITAYHVTIVSECAWLSANTHALTMLVINSRVSGSNATPAPASPRRREQRVVLAMVTRAFLKASLVAMLLYVNWITGAADWYDNFACPSACLVDHPKGGENLQWMIANLVLLLFWFPTSIMFMFRTFATAWVFRIRHHVVDDKGRSYKGLIYNSQKSAPNNNTQTVTRGGVQRAVTLFSRYAYVSLWYLLASEAKDVAEQMAWFGMGVWSLLTDRRYGHQVMGNEETGIENSWGFGQLVPLLLLLVPLLQLLESIQWNIEEYQDNEG